MKTYAQNKNGQGLPSQQMLTNNLKIKIVELGGIDPPASCMLSRRSTIWATAPLLDENDP